MQFPTTNWTQLAAATLSGDTLGRSALAAVCAGYRGPVVAFLRTRGFGAAAEDAAHDFFLSLIESRAWRRADRARGRFRTFLLGALVHVVAKGAERERAEKRGAGQPSLSFEALADDGLEPAEPSAPETHFFDYEWALHLMDTVLAGVAQSLTGNGSAAQWPVLVRFLPGSGGPPSYEEAAAELGLSLAATKSAVHRVRGRFREDLRAAVARTVSAPHEIDEELRYLQRVLSSSPG